MRPCSRKTLKSGNLLQNIGLGVKNSVASISGTVKKLGVNYKKSIIVIYSKDNLSPVAVRKPDNNSKYEVFGLNNSMTCFVVAFDDLKQYNAVIQDGVVPK